MARLLGAAVSVFGGRDEAWTAAEKAQRVVEQQRLREQLNEATDLDSIRAAAEAQVASAEIAAANEREVYDELLADADHRVVEMQVQIDSLSADRQRLAAKLQALQHSRSDTIDPDDEWSVDDELSKLAEQNLRVMPDLIPLLDRLEQISGGALVVTDNAREVCASTDYPDPVRMAENLIRLTGAAIEYRDAGGAVGNNVHDWLEQRGVVNSTLDDSLRKLKLHGFVHEGRDLDRTPHVKVDDHRHPDQVGRIYFAIDQLPPSGSARFIVDHIGQKLYLKAGNRTRKGRD